MQLRLLMTTLLTLLITLNGCFGSRIVKHPDSPMLIEEVSWNKASVAIYHKETNRMIHYGWVDIEPGLTLREFDWEKFINERNNDD